MKNKVLATLLAVCLFAGLAVPAFASTTSSQSGDSTEVTMVSFAKESYTIPQDGSEDFADEVQAFVDKTQLVLDPQLTYELEDNNAGVFSIGDDVVYAVEKSGTATLIVKNIDEKVVGKVKVNAGAAKPATRNATGFMYEKRSYDIPVASLANAATSAVAAGNFEIVVKPLPAGSAFTAGNKAIIDAAVKEDIANALGLGHVVTIGGSGNTGDIMFPTLPEVTEGTPVTVTVDAAAATGTNDAAKATVTAAYASDNVTLTFTSDYATAATAATFTATDINNAIKAMTGTGVPAALKAVKVDVISPISVILADSGSAATLVPDVSKVDAKDDPDSNNRIYTVKGSDLPATLAKAPVYAAANKNINTEVQIDEGDDVTKPRTSASKAIVKAVPGKVSIGLSAPSSITVEVGEVFKLGDQVKHVASDSNIKGTVSYEEDFATSADDVYDYAIVADNGKVTGVKVGKNKVLSRMSYIDKNGASVTKTATTLVTVVAKGTKPAPATGNTTVLSAWAPKLGVGETANIVVKADGDVTYKSLNEAVATVDAAGKITAVKEGVAKISVQEEGKDVVYLTVTVGATTTKPEDKPTDVPQTAVAALVALF